jgi:hypothetical protein
MDGAPKCCGVDVGVTVIGDAFAIEKQVLRLAFTLFRVAQDDKYISPS